MQNIIEKMEIARVSSKGQLVIPQDIRQKMKIKEGSLIAVASYGDMVLLKKVKKFINDEDMQSLKLVEEAWEDIEKGRYKTASLDEFLRQAREW